MKIDTGNHQINIESSGNPDGPVVLMAHSLGCNLHMWDPQMPALESDYRVVRLDMRGHGQSDVPDGPYTLDSLADDVIAVMDHLSISAAHWVGLSVGGMIGQSLLLRYPDRFLSAMLCDTASTQPQAAGPIWEGRIKAVEDNGLESIADATLERWFTDAFRTSDKEAVMAVRTQLVTTPDAGYIACSRAIMALDYIDRLSEIKTPVCILVGADDVATPVAGSEAMHAKIPHSQLEIVDGAAHIANVEQADVFNGVMLEFLQSVA